MERKYQIFISSTFSDLTEEREKIRSAILKMNHFPVSMEIFSSDSEEQWSTIQKSIDTSDYFVLILAHKYGTVIKNADGTEISYTEKEYRYAKQKGIPIYCFLIGDSVKVAPEQIDRKHEKQLKMLKNELKNEKMVEWWYTVDDLALKITTALYKAMDEHPRPGWVRSDRTVRLDSGFIKLSWDEFYRHVNLLVKKLKQSESLGGFDFDILVGISRGGTSVADLMAREFGQNMPILSLFAYRSNRKTSFSSVGNIMDNKYVLQILKKDLIQRILVIDSFTRNGTSIIKAKEYLNSQLNGKIIKSAVVYADESLRTKARTVKKIDYIGDFVDLKNRKLSLD